jgi:hypothetical protein
MQAKPSKSDFAAEIEALETAIEKGTSSHHARSSATPLPGKRLAKAVRFVTDMAHQLLLDIERAAELI